MHFSIDDVYNIGFDVIEKVFKQKLPSLGFSIREPQLEMAEEILDLVAKKQKCLVIEAGVGTGKSYGYLIPLLILHDRSRSKFSIIISTGTISLQEQVIRDLYTLKEMLSIQFDIVLAKGQTHFLCLNRLSNHFANQKHPEWTKNLKEYSEFGDRAELEKGVKDIAAIWEKINIQNCSFNKCKYYSQCDYISLRDNMKKKGSVIVTNHDQLLANARNLKSYKKPLFSEDTEIIVVDEAHNLEDKARNALKESWSLRNINALLRAAYQYLQSSDNYKEINQQKSKIDKLVKSLFQIIYLHCLEIATKQTIEGHDIQRFSLPPLQQLLLEELVDELESFNTSLQLLDVVNDNFNNTIDSFDDLISFLESMYSDDSKIFWIEGDLLGSEKISLNSVPKEMNEIISSYFFSDNSPTMILTSATISQPGPTSFEKYEYFFNTLGIDFMNHKKLAYSDPKKSPFNYKKNALLYISSSLPIPNKIDSFRSHAIAEIIKLLELTDGRSMILFTSKADMQHVASQLREKNLPWELLVQKEGGSQDGIKRRFIENENSILLSTGTYWEGIDIPGPSLSNLIIYKLPFPVPDPILDYKSSLSSNSLMEVYVPEMVIKLRQGLGRLIRNETDIGIATILDSRVGSIQDKDYKKLVIESLPFSEVTENFQEVESFVKKKLKY